MDNSKLKKIIGLFLLFMGLFTFLLFVLLTRFTAPKKSNNKQPVFLIQEQKLPSPGGERETEAVGFIGWLFGEKSAYAAQAECDVDFSETNPDPNVDVDGECDLGWQGGGGAAATSFNNGTTHVIKTTTIQCSVGQTKICHAHCHNEITQQDTAQDFVETCYECLAPNFYSPNQCPPDQCGKLVMTGQPGNQPCYVCVPRNTTSCSNGTLPVTDASTCPGASVSQCVGVTFPASYACPAGTTAVDPAWAPSPPVKCCTCSSQLTDCTPTSGTIGQCVSDGCLVNDPLTCQLSATGGCKYNGCKVIPATKCAGTPPNGTTCCVGVAVGATSCPTT